MCVAALTASPAFLQGKICVQDVAVFTSFSCFLSHILIVLTTWSFTPCFLSHILIVLTVCSPESHNLLYNVFRGAWPPRPYWRSTSYSSRFYRMEVGNWAWFGNLSALKWTKRSISELSNDRLDNIELNMQETSMFCFHLSLRGLLLHSFLGILAAGHFDSYI